ncbi:MAG: 1-deoxy-D-xylulose-5-phosphate synthase [Verrucomicrobiales bacterium]
MKSRSSPDPAAPLPPIHSPADIKKLEEKDLLRLAEEVRRVLIEALSKTGGHLGPNLGVVELTIALHRVFDTPRDKLVFDVSHQGYVHKMLTGRWNRIQSMRTYQGLNGFLLRTESEHDCYGAGHAGTALSAALGLAVGRDLTGSDEHVVCIAGDAAFTCGPTFEALNNVAASTRRLIVVLNDNEWSIDRNVGAIAKYFNQLVTNPTYAHLHEMASSLVEKVGGKAVKMLARKIEEGAKNLLLPSVIFEEFGFRYYGPIDGHDLPTLIRVLEFLKTQNEPVVLHILTEKGRGYKPALANPGKFHGLGPYKTETGETELTSTPTYSQIYAETLVRMAREDHRITAITAAMPGGTGLSLFKKEIPARYFDVGIAEEHAALFACGQAIQGLRPWLTIYSTFMQRAYDMIIHDIALQNLPVRLAMDRAGLSGDDGPTHHGLFDIGYLRHVPNFIFCAARDEEEFVDMLWTLNQHDGGPSAIRYPRGTGTGAKPKADPEALEIGKAEVVHDGEDVALIALGGVFDLAEQAREQLRKLGYSVALINARWIKPLDAAAFEAYARRCKVLCTFEDHVLFNGFGAAVIETLHAGGINTPVERIGWPDSFIEHGKISILREKHGVTPEAAVAKCLAHLTRKPAARPSAGAQPAARL